MTTELIGPVDDLPGDARALVELGLDWEFGRLAARRRLRMPGAERSERRRRSRRAPVPWPTPRQDDAGRPDGRPRFLLVPIAPGRDDIATASDLIARLRGRGVTLRIRRDEVVDIG